MTTGAGGRTDRPAIGAVVSWAEARADMEAHPEARWHHLASDIARHPHRMHDGVMEMRSAGVWVLAPRIDGSWQWTRLPDAAPEPQERAKYDRAAALRLAGFDPTSQLSPTVNGVVAICEAIVDAKMGAKP